MDAAAKLPVPENVAIKAPSDFRLIGTPHRRLDIAGKVDGSAKFGIDTRLPFPVDDAGFYTKDAPGFGPDREGGPARVIDDNGKKVRVCRKCGAEL